MAFTKGHNKQFLLTGALAIALTAFSVTACSGGGAPSLTQGSAPGQWTAAEVSQFTAAGGGAGGGSANSCIIRYFEQDMSFGNAMAVVSVDPASDTSKTLAQIEAAVVSKYGTTAGDVVNTQFAHVATDATTNCSS
jgi:hypothetical protein